MPVQIEEARRCKWFKSARMISPDSPPEGCDPHAPKLRYYPISILGQSMALGTFAREHNSMGFAFVWAFTPLVF